MRNFLDTVEGADVVKGINARGETSVEAEDLVVDKGGQGKIIKQVRKVLPDIGIAILAEALVVESVDLCDLAGLVVSTKDGNSLGVADFEGNKESDCFDRVVTSINVIT